VVVDVARPEDGGDRGAGTRGHDPADDLVVAAVAADGDDKGAPGLGEVAGEVTGALLDVAGAVG